MISLEVSMAVDLLMYLGAAETVNHYSPTAQEIAQKCSKIYSSLEHGIFSVKESHVLVAAKKLELQMKERDQEIRIAVSKVKLSELGNRIFSKAIVCKHNYIPYVLIYSEVLKSAEVKPICPNCKNGFEAPDRDEVEEAKAYMKTGVANPNRVFSTGTLIVAGQELGFESGKPVPNSTIITRKKGTLP